MNAASYACEHGKPRRGGCVDCLLAKTKANRKSVAVAPVAPPTPAEIEAHKNGRGRGRFVGPFKTTTASMERCRHCKKALPPDTEVMRDAYAVGGMAACLDCSPTPREFFSAEERKRFGWSK